MGEQPDETVTPPGSATESPLPGPREQTRNVFLFGANTSLSYLASAVTFTNIHAPLCDKLGANATVANLPSTMYLAFAALPLFVAWYFPQVALFRRILVVSYAAFAVASALVVAALLSPLPNGVKIAAVVAHGAATGATLTVAVTFLFEALGRAATQEGRGKALSLGYGVGPVLAVLGSLGSQFILEGAARTTEARNRNALLCGQALSLGYGVDPALAVVGNVGARMTLADAQQTAAAVNRYTLLFALSVPIMSLAAFFASLFVVIPPKVEATRQPFVAGVFGGAGEFLGDRVLRLASVIAVLMFSGYHVHDNMTLYTRQALGAATEEYLGYQNVLRYSFKIAVGLFAGWLLARTHPKATLLFTAALGLAGVGWAITTFGAFYMLSFGLLGGGELFGVYITNYILAASPPAQVRRNLGFAVLLLFPAAFSGPIFGGIRDGISDPTLGFRLSFALAAVMIVFALVFILLLPARPEPGARAKDVAGTG